jgi:hypothetical protein
LAAACKAVSEPSFDAASITQRSSAIHALIAKTSPLAHASRMPGGSGAPAAGLPPSRSKLIVATRRVAARSFFRLRLWKQQ